MKRMNPDRPDENRLDLRSRGAWLLRLPAIAVLFAPSACAAASPSSGKQPELLERTLALRGCPKPEWTALPKDGWFAHCASTARGGGTHRLYAFVRGADKSYTMQRFAEYEEVPDTGERPTRELKVEGSRLRLKETRPFGAVHSRVWDLAAAPARLVEESAGGLQACRAEMAANPMHDYANADMAEPVCTTDFVARRQTCVRDHPDCNRNPERLKKLPYTAIPLHSTQNRLKSSDPLGCATTIGLEPGELISGSNRKKTSFQVVGVQDPQAEVLRLMVRIDDKTPQLGRGVHDDWQLRDHFELWLASDRDDVVCESKGQLQQFCRELALRFKLVQQIIVPLADRSFLIFPSVMKPSPPRSENLQARYEGSTIVIELRGPAYQAAYHGALTLVYSDSLDGKKADTLIGTSPLQAGVAETPGRLGDYALCDVTDRPDEEVGELVKLK